MKHSEFGGPSNGCGIRLPAAQNIGSAPGLTLRCQERTAAFHHPSQSFDAQFGRSAAQVSEPAGRARSCHSRRFSNPDLRAMARVDPIVAIHRASVPPETYHPFRTRRTAAGQSVFRDTGPQPSEYVVRGNREGNLCSQTSIDCWAKIPAIAPCDDAVVTEGMRGLARSPAA